MLTKQSIKRPFTVIVMLIVIAIIGGIAVVKMPLDLFPDMELPYMIVATMVPGASPEEVEKKVTVPMEESMRQINNVKDVQSISADSVSAVIMALKNGTNLTTMTQDIDTSIKSIKGQFPAMTMEPIIMKIDPDMMPIMTLAISKDGKTIDESSDELLEIADKIRSVGGVASVSTTGQIANNAFVQIDAERILRDPSNLIANHLSTYLSNPLKPMPKVLSDFLATNTVNMNGLTMPLSGIVDMVKTSPSLVASMLKGKLDLTPIIGENKDMFLSAFASMLSPEMVSMMLTANNFDMPAGTVPVQGVDLIIKIGEKFNTFDDLIHMPAFSLDLRELKLADKNDPGYESAPTAIEMMKPMLDNLVKPTLTGVEFTKILDTLVKAPVAPGEGATQEEKAQYEKDKKAYEANIVIATNLLGNVLYTRSGDTYVRNQDVYNYLIGILYQPITVELNDFAYVYNTNTASSAHTIINGADGMMLSIYKTPDASVTSVTDGIVGLLKDMDKNDETFNYIVLSNQGEVTKFMISSIAQNLLLGALFAVIVLLIFLRDWKPTLTVGMSIIISLVTAFAVMYLSGVTLNLVSMGGLALSVGMLVDNSIVVIENIYRKRNEGVSPIKAAYEGTKQVAGAILSSTITTVIVFLPIIFVDGIAKQIFMDLAITIAVSLFASLVVAITFVPMVSSRMVNLNKASRHESKAFTKLKNGYGKALNFMLDKKWITVSVVLLLFVGSIVSMFFMKVEFMPDTTMDQIMITTGIDQSKLDEHYSYDEAVDDIIKDIDKEFGKKDYIESKGVELSAGMSVMGFSMGGGNIVSYVTLKPKAKIKPADATRELNEIIEGIAKDDKYPEGMVVPGGISNAGGIDVQGMVNSYLDASLLTVNLYGQDVSEMASAALKLEEQFRNELSPLDANISINNGLLNETREFKLIIDEPKASRYNLTTAQIFLQYFEATVPKTANSTINFTGDIGNSNIYIYTLDNNMDRWYRVRDNEGKAHRLYFDKADATKDAKKFYERCADGTTKEFTKETRNELTIFTAQDGTEYSIATNDMPVYYDNSKINETDMITQPISIPKFGEMPDMNTDMMPMAEQGGDLVQKEVLPIFMLLDTRSFETDMLGNVVYRNTTDARFKNYDSRIYYEDKDHYIRYNYTGDDITMLKSLDPSKDINPKVPAGIKQVVGFNTISHVEGKRVVQMGVKSSVLSNKQLEKEVRRVIKDFNAREDIPAKISAEFVGANEVITETFNGLFLMIGLAIVFIYLVMVAQFQSLKSPFIIMFTIPLALTGSILTLLMAGMPISVFALTGIILLIGIVVNNGIVFVDYANKLRESGMPKREALIRTAQDRIRPILMTALTTICSMLISVFDTSMGASAIKPMAVTVVGGLTYATLLTLFFVPILYDAFNRKEKLAVIKFDDDKEEDIEAEMRMSKINTIKEAMEESNTLQMMDEGYIANNMTTDSPIDTNIDEAEGDTSDEETERSDEHADEVVAEDDESSEDTAQESAIDDDVLADETPTAEDTAIDDVQCQRETVETEPSEGDDVEDSTLDSDSEDAKSENRD